MNDRQAFIDELRDKKIIHEQFSENDLDPSGEGRMGRAEAEVSINADDPDAAQRNSMITVRVTSYFADESETIVSMLKKGANISHSYQGEGPETFTDGVPFDPDPVYSATETELNNRTRSTDPVIVGNEIEISHSNAYNDNTADQSTVDAAIPDADSPRELTWLNRTIYSTTLGTTHYPNIGDGENSYSDTRRFVTPKNGRWTLNPLQEGNGSSRSPNSNSPTAVNNTRLLSFSMGDFTDMDLQIRLGGYDRGDLKNGTNYYNSLLMFDFTDNEGSELNNPYVEYYHNNRFSNGVTHLWHPQKWKSMTIYTQKTSEAAVNGGVNARLVFGPYGHKYYTYIDFWNWGRYMGNPWYGQEPGDFEKAFPGNQLASSNRKTRTGMAYLPEYFGNDFHLYFLDDTDKNVLLLQGVNILGTDAKHSTLYSRRGVEIGGGLVKSSNTDGMTVRNVNSNVQGIDYGDAPNYANYYGFTTRYSQILYNTDIILRTPNGSATPRTSTIRNADLPTTGIYNNSNIFSDEENKKYTPTVRIIGGQLYVGEGHTLNISGGSINPKPNEDGENEKTLTVSPSSLTVASGGALTLQSSPYFNVTTDLFIDGDMTMSPGARAQGNIIVGEGGSVTTGALSRFEGDIHIGSGGEFIVGPNSQITGDIHVSGGGTLTIGTGSAITGDVYCAGALNVEGDFTLNCRTPAKDNVETLHIDESVMKDGRYPYHGIFIYDDQSIGTGTLNITGTPEIAGNSGKIHAFSGYAGISHALGNATFCDDRTGNNICTHWTSTSNAWQRRD
jgi:hypothetical protein